MAQDYNIYLHSVGGSGSGDGKKTTPKQLKDDGRKNKTTPKAVAKKVFSVLQNPDSAIGMAMNSATGAISKAAGTGSGGVALVAVGAAVGIADKVIEMYNYFYSSSTGNYQGAIQYNNFKTVVKNFFNPVENYVESRKAVLEIRKQNAINEQQMLLTGGTILNSEYGRYL